MNISSDMYTLTQRWTVSWKTTSRHLRLFFVLRIAPQHHGFRTSATTKVFNVLVFFLVRSREVIFQDDKWREWPTWRLAMRNACDGSPWPFMTDRSLLFPIRFSLVLFRVSFPGKSFVLLAFPNSLPTFLFGRWSFKAPPRAYPLWFSWPQSLSAD